MSAFVSPVLLTVIVAIVCAVLLTIASIVFFVPVDETASKIRAVLAGANCGACGYAGCDDYANALAADHDLPCDKCAPAGAAATAAIAEILGVAAGSAVPKVAMVKCSGTPEFTKTAMEYQGIRTCASAKDFFGGPGECKFGCIGYGDCTRACKFDAITVVDGVAQVDREKCTGCGACSQVCPKSVIEMVPKTNRVYVGCSSLDMGKIVNQICKTGCIACKLCEKECKFDAIHVEGNLAKIDPVKCKNCTLCAKKCPKHIIHVIPKPGQKPAVKVVDPNAAPAAKPAEAPAAPAAPAQAAAPAEAPKAEA